MKKIYTPLLFAMCLLCVRASGQTTPVLSPAINATVDNSFDITFTDDASWRAAITSISAGTTNLVAGTDYTVSAGQITLIPTASNPLNTPGDYTITVFAAGYDDATVSQAISAGVPANLTVNTQPTGPPASGSQLSTQPVITAKDKYDNPVSGSYSITVAETSGQAGSWILGGTTTANTNSSGVASFTNLKATNTSSAPYTATITFDYNSVAVVSSTFIVPAVAPTLTAAPDATVDNSFAVTFTDNANWRSAVTSITVDGSALSTSAYSTTSSGKIVFNPANDILLRSPGTKSIVITATDFSTTSVSQNIDAGEPFSLTISTQPKAPATSGGTLSVQPVITAKDQYGNLVSGSYAIVASETSGQSSNWNLGGTSSVNTNSSGVATFTNLTATNLTSNSFSATITFSYGSETITSESFTIPTLTPPTLTAASNATVDNPFAVTFTDNAGWRGAITSVTINGTTLSSSAYSTSTAGQITFNPANDALLRSPGTKAIVIVAPGYSNATISQTINAGAPATLIVTTQPGAPVSSGAVLSVQPEITAKDKYGNLVTDNYAITATVTSGQESSWTLGGTTIVNTNSSGIATYTNLTATNISPAPYNAKVTFSYNSIPVNSASFLIPAVAPALTAALGATVDNSFAITFTENASWRAAITGITVDGTNLVAGTDYTRSPGQITFIPNASNPLHTPGAYTITISATNYSDATVIQTISAGVPAMLTVTTQPIAPANSGGVLATQPVITAKDKYNNIVSGSFAIVAAVTSGQGASWTLGGTTTVNTNSSGVAVFTNLTATNLTSNPYSASITFTYNTVTASSTSFIIPTLTPPTLTAASNATVDNPFNISFTDNASWRTAIKSITVGVTTLVSGTDYTISAGQIILIPTATNPLRIAGTYTFTVTATGYSNTTVSQIISAGAPAALTISTQPGAPATYNALLNPQPIVSTKDKYGNTVTGAYTITAVVTTGQGSSWTLGGTTGVATSSTGVATFTNLTATNLTTNNYTGASITFSYGGVTKISNTFTIPAPPPPNDDCSNAITLTPAVSPTAVSGIFLSATPTPGLSYDPTKKDVWYKFTPICTSLHTITINFTGGTNIDVDVDVFTGTCPTSGTATTFGHTAGGSKETITTSFDAGTTYYMRVIDHGATSAGTFNISVTVNAPAQPPAITGNTTPCLGSTEIYSVTPTSGVIYTWTLPSGWTGSSTTNSVQAIVGSTAGNIILTPSNACGLSGTSQTLAINPFTSPQNVTGISVSPDNGKLVVSWNNPNYCFDEVMVIATDNNNVTLVPAGDGSLYIDTTEYASQTRNNGLNMNTGEYCIYKGISSATIITGLLNSNPYTIKIFTRWGTQWSSGIQVTNNTPIAEINGTYKSVKSGLWTDNTVWNKLVNGVWVATSNTKDYPNAYNTDVSIESGTVVQLDAGLTSVKNLTVKSAGQLWTNSPDQSGQRTSYIAVFGSSITCNGTIGSNKSGGNQADNISFNIEGLNVTISGSGTFGCARITKAYSAGTTGGFNTTTLNINMDINLFLKGTDLCNNADGDKNASTAFNVILNNPYKITLNHPTSDIAIDGDNGKNGNSRTRGTFTINGTLTITGTLYLTTDNSTGSCTFIIGPTGKVYTNKVRSDPSGVAKHTLTINNGGLLNITDVAGFGNFSPINNNEVLNFGVTSTVEYAATSTGQQVLSGQTYGNLTISGAGEKIITNDYSNLTVMSNLGIVAGNTFNLNDRTLLLNGTINGTGTMTGSGKSNITIGPSGTSAIIPLGVLRFTTGRDSLSTLTMDRKMPANVYPSNTYYAAILGTNLKTFNLILNQGILATDKNLLTLITYPTNGYSFLNKTSYVATTDAAATAFSVGNTFDGSYGFRINGVKAKTNTFFPVGADFISPNRMMVNLLNNAATRDMTVVLTKGDIGYTGSPRANRLWYVGSSVNDSVNAQVQLYYTGYDLASKPYMTKQDELETGFTGTGVRLVEKANLSDPYFTNISNAQNNVLFNGSPGTEVMARSNTADSVYDGTHPGIFRFSIFSIVDGDQVVLPVTFIGLRAYQQGTGISINWSVANEINIGHYEVERAGDGRLFNVVTTRQAQNSGSAGNSYSAADEQPLTGSNYYRIKAIGKDRQVLYSTIINVTLGSDGKASLLVYPNPIRNSSCNVQLTNLAAGTYNFGIYSLAGQQIALKQVEHAGGSSNLKLNLPAGTAAGVYVVRLTGQNIHMQTSVFVSGK